MGGLLIAAAGLKLAALATSALPPAGWTAQPWVQAAAGGWELVLGAWLLGGAAPRAAWAAAVVTFLAFAGVSASLGLAGIADCGCLGAVPASPWLAFGVDVAALALLAVGRPRATGATPRPAWGGMLTGSAAALVLVGAAGSWVYGSPTAALARLRGDTLIAEPPYLDLGTVPAGERQEAPLTVTNWSAGPLRLIGGTSDCTCTTLSDLPVTIPPGGRAVVTIRLVPPQGAGHLLRAVMLRTDSPDQPELRVRIGCRVE
ncbi:MAG: DUF1573 domain-containing protein [Gemmataceae bacterium]